MKNTIIALVVIIIIAIFGFAFYKGDFNQSPTGDSSENGELTEDATSTTTATSSEPEATGPEKVIGQSSEG